MTDRPSWFSRTFGSLDSAAPSPLPLAGGGAAESSDVEAARLVGKAEALSAATVVARGYEARGANAAAVRIALAYRADEAWDRAEAHRHRPLDEAEVGVLRDAQGISPLPEPSASSSGAVDVRQRLTAVGPPPVPLDPRDARIRLELVVEQLDIAIRGLDTIADRVSGGATWRLATEGADFLRTIQAFARGETRLKLPPPEPQSIRVGPPALRVIPGDPAA